MNFISPWPHTVRLSIALLVGAGSIASARTPNPAFERDYFRVPQPTSFAQCPQFFVGGKPPAVPVRPMQRELCYEAFAVLHSDETRTPVYVAQRLNRRTIEQADEKRADKFFADARLPSSERAELEDYKRSGYSRGHMAPAGDMSTPTAMAQMRISVVAGQQGRTDLDSWNGRSKTLSSALVVTFKSRMWAAAQLCRVAFLGDPGRWSDQLDSRYRPKAAIREVKVDDRFRLSADTRAKLI